MNQQAGKWLEGLSAADGAPAWVAGLRDRGAEAFRHLGLPSGKDEAWKYTSLQAFEALKPGPDLTGGGEIEYSAPAPLAGSPAIARLVDGCLAETSGDLPQGLEILPLHEAWNDVSLRRLIESLETGRRGQGLAALNEATLRSGALIRVGRDVDAGDLLLQWVVSHGVGRSIVNSRIAVLMGQGAKLHLVEQYENGANEQAALNVVVQHDLAAGSELTHTRVQRQSASSVLVTRTEAAQAADSRFQFTGLDLGAGLARHDVKSSLLAEGAGCALNGACLGQGTSHADHHFEAAHAAGNCTSKQLFRAVADGRSRVVFNGRVHVAEGADGTEATQSSAGLLLSRLAEIDPKPELEIHADEVVASHGATVGQLDEEAMFYLRSRGLREHEARALLTTAFCRGVTDQLPDGALRESLGERVAERLYGGAG
jgi:Fe-S cluster assembly protein SufD